MIGRYERRRRAASMSALPIDVAWRATYSLQIGIELVATCGNAAGQGEGPRRLPTVIPARSASWRPAACTIRSKPCPARRPIDFPKVCWAASTLPSWCLPSPRRWRSWLRRCLSLLPWVTARALQAPMSCRDWPLRCSPLAMSGCCLSSAMPVPSTRSSRRPLARSLALPDPMSRWSPMLRCAAQRSGRFPISLPVCSIRWG